MNRELKFRAWNNIKNQMWNWSDIIKDPQYLRSVLCGEYYPTAEKKYFWVPMQYTGLRDDNGIEIYEGDEVEFEQHDSWSDEWIAKNGVVVFDDGQFSPIPNNNGLIRKFKVTGNVYES